MPRLINRLYAIYALVTFYCIFLVLLLPFLLVIHVGFLRKYSYHLNKLWAWLSFLVIGIPVRKQYEASLDPTRPYVFCANHSSLMDIPAIGLTVNQFVVFMGKAALNQVPLFGYMFKRLHIPVDRDSIKDSYRAFEAAKAIIRQGRSVLIFPEGNMRNAAPPELRRFKDGAFRMAIEEQIPIVPVSIPYNWQIMFAYSMQMRWRPNLVVYHAPIETDGMTLADMQKLKGQVHDVIMQELLRCNASKAQPA